MKTLLKQCDHLIRLGKGNEALTALQKAVKSGVPEAHIPEVANLLRRGGDSYTSVRILYKALLAKRDTEGTLWNQMQAEYGAGLNAIGCVEQARSVLNKVDAAKFPFAFLYRAFTHLSEWDYAGAKPHLEKCLKHFKPASEGTLSYWQLVVMVNILSTDVFERNHDAVREGISKLMAHTERTPELKLLRAAVFELVAQHSIEMKFYQRAEEYLFRAEADLRGFSGNSRLFIKKWLAIAGMMKDGLTQANIDKLVEVRMQAEKRRHWETIRSLDLHEAIATKSEPEFLRVMYGTPFLSYRERIVEDFPGKLLPSAIAAVPLRRKENAKYFIDLHSGVIKKNSENSSVGHERVCLDPMGLETQVLRELARDIFRPVSLSLLYNKLHPNMNYQPGMNSIVKKIIEATQLQLTEQKIPLKLVQSNGFVSLDAQRGVAFLVPTGIQRKAAA